MHSKHLGLALLVACGSMVALAAGPSLVVNGLFEPTNTTAGACSFDTFSTIAGWTVKDQIEIRGTRVGKAFEGNNFAELDAENNKNNTISQGFATQIGGSYTFSFECSNRPFDSVAPPQRSQQKRFWTERRDRPLDRLFASTAHDH